VSGLGPIASNAGDPPPEAAPIVEHTLDTKEAAREIGHCWCIDVAAVFGLGDSQGAILSDRSLLRSSSRS
jgi:hypothetical protein